MVKLPACATRLFCYAAYSRFKEEEFVKVVYLTNQEKSISVQFNNSTHTFSPGETFDMENSMKDNTLQIYTQKTNEMSIWSAVILFLKRIVLNVFNVIIMNFSGEWLDTLDPFTLSATYTTECKSMILKYIPAKISKFPITVEKPQLIIDDKPVDAKIELDINAVNVGFAKYCFELVSLWVYCSLLTTLIFVHSGKLAALITIFVLILAVITAPVIFKIIKVYNEKQELLDYLVYNKNITL